MSQTQVLPRLGRIYQHYKGASYKFLLIGRDEETQADLAIYSAVEGGQVWVRPLIEFQPPRFVELPPAPDSAYKIPSAKQAREMAKATLYSGGRKAR